jgi:hypothetical protein
MLAMFHGGGAAPQRFVSEAVSFRRAQVSFITTMLLRGAWATFLFRR